MNKTPERLLIVDDDPILTNVLSEVFTALDFDCRTAGDKVSARQFINRLKFEALLIDFLPRGAACDVIRIFVEANPQAGVLLLNGNSSPDIQRVASKAAASLVLERPIITSELVERLRELLTLNAPPVATSTKAA